MLKIVVTLTKKGGGERRERTAKIQKIHRFVVRILRIWVDLGTFYLWYDTEYENYVTLN